ncbi:hypothetical protein Tco_0169128 [Tanacetum coccineum]
MEILLEPTSNKLLVGDLQDSIRIKLMSTGKKRWCNSISYTLSWKPCQGDSLNLPDHSQMAYLHENLLKGLNVKLAVRIILETVIIDDAIRACEVTITRDDIKTWDKTLKAFEKIIMKVMFLRALISKLKGLLFESNELLEAKRKEQAKAEEEMKIIKEKLHRRRG